MNLVRSDESRPVTVHRKTIKTNAGDEERIVLQIGLIRATLTLGQWSYLVGPERRDGYSNEAA